MEPRPQLENWQRQVAEAGSDAVADMDVAKRLLKHGIEALGKIESLKRQLAESEKFHSAGRYCMSEDDCIAAGIPFGAYERGVSDAIASCERIAKGE